MHIQIENLTTEQMMEDEATLQERADKKLKAFISKYGNDTQIKNQFKTNISNWKDILRDNVVCQTNKFF